jgi:mycothiol synthase
MTPAASRHSSTRFRELNSDRDWWAIRDLLVRTHSSTAVGWNWDIRHWDGSRFHRESPEQARVLQQGVGLWEQEGRLVAAIHCEDDGEAFFELDPDHRHLEPEMLDWAEARLGLLVDGQHRLQTFVFDHDLTRRALLAERGYTMLESGGWTRLIRFGASQIPHGMVPLPYRVATTSAETTRIDAQLMADLLNASFGRTQHTAAEYLAFMAGSPSFSHDLNLVAVTPDGAFAAHVGVTFDAINRFGVFEPVCTHPDHQRKGLARALMLEGMRRLRDRGALSASVETGEMEPANALYRSCGFTEEYHGRWFARMF